MYLKDSTISLINFHFSITGSTHDPEFDVPLPNLTVKQGTDVSFTCIVKHLGPHKVSFVLRLTDIAAAAVTNNDVNGHIRAREGKCNKDFLFKAHPLHCLLTYLLLEL